MGLMRVNPAEEYILQVPYLQLQHKSYHALEALEILKGSRPDLIFLSTSICRISPGMQLASLLPPKQLLHLHLLRIQNLLLKVMRRMHLDYLVEAHHFRSFLKAVMKASSQLSRKH